MERILCLAVGYLFGLFQTGYLYGKSQGIDIRSEGSGNAGTTNSLRVLGIKAGLITFAGDLCKAILAVLLVNGKIPDIKGCAIATASISALIATFIRPCKTAKVARGVLFGLWALFFGNRLYVHAAEFREIRILLWAVFFFLAAAGVSLHKGLKYKKRNI